MADSAQDPQGPAQPTVNDANKAPENAVSREPAEAESAKQISKDQKNEDATAKRQANDVHAPERDKERGVHGAPPGEEAKGYSEDDVGRHREDEGEQMSTPAEGDVASAVRRKPGAGG